MFQSERRNIFTNILSVIECVFNNIWLRKNTEDSKHGNSKTHSLRGTGPNTENAMKTFDCIELVLNKMRDGIKKLSFDSDENMSENFNQPERPTLDTVCENEYDLYSKIIAQIDSTFSTLDTFNRVIVNNCK
nr:PREDICTED: uncharacterized protein LOC107397825 [Tribolium castaneum]|eukprot:XP_015834918.1 PREDICTED: uncharacterized protein LOC107397825 [Tribolium castaneum]